MTSVRFDYPPPVEAGDADSFLRRAKWYLEHSPVDDEALAADVDVAMRVGPDRWEPWAWQAYFAELAPSRELACLDEAVARGAGPAILWWRMNVHTRLGKLLEAERDGLAVLELCSSDPEVVARERRESLCPFRPHELDQGSMAFVLGTLCWIKGDLPTAYRTFSDWRVRGYGWSAVWTHLCRLANGENQPAPIAASGLRRWSGVSIGRHSWFEFQAHEGPPQPSVLLWDLLAALYAGSLSEKDWNDATRTSFAASNVTLTRSHPVPDLVARITPRGSEPVQPGQLRFYRGMWLLQTRRMDEALAELDRATGADSSDDLEKVAAAAQLRRIGQPRRSPARPVKRLAAHRPARSTAAARFVRGTLGEPFHFRTFSQSWLSLGGEPIGDEGLKAILDCPRMGEVVGLGLVECGLTPAAVRLFTTSRWLGQLKFLTIRSEPLGDEGLRALVSSPRLTSLKGLTIGDIGVSEDGMRALLSHELPSLEHVDITDPLSFALWFDLLRRFGRGLMAAARLPQNLLEGISPGLQVCFVTQAPPLARMLSWEPRDPTVLAAAEVRLSDGRWCEMTFRMIDYLSYRWRRNTELDPLRRQVDPLAEATELLELTASCRTSTEPVIRLESNDGFEILRERFDPIAVRCPACTYWHRRPVRLGRTASPIWGAGRITWTCPSGHVLGTLDYSA